MPIPSVSALSSASVFALAMVATLAPWNSLVGPVVAQETAGPARGADAPPQARLDRIEVKLDALLQRLGTGPNVGDAVPFE